MWYKSKTRSSTPNKQESTKTRTSADQNENTKSGATRAHALRLPNRLSDSRKEKIRWRRGTQLLLNIARNSLQQAQNKNACEENGNEAEQLRCVNSASDCSIVGSSPARKCREHAGTRCNHLPNIRDQQECGQLTLHSRDEDSRRKTE